MEIRRIPPNRPAEIEQSRPRFGVAAAVAVAAALGPLTGWFTPRGPVTAAQALTR